MNVNDEPTEKMLVDQGSQEPTRSAEDDHEPEASSDLSADEANERLRRGEPLENVRIERLVLDGEYPEPIMLKHVTLVQPKFKKAIFKKDVSFIACEIDRPLVDKSAVFEGAWTLSHCRMNKTHFSGLTVKGNVKANDLRAEGRFLITKSRFEKSVNFWEAEFDCWVDFRDCEFEGEFDCRSAHMHEGLVFNRCRFASDFLFRGTSMSKKWEAIKTRFEGLVDFSKAKLHDYVYLETIEQGDKQSFGFNNTLGERILIRPEQIEGRMASERDGKFDQAMHEYAYLKRAFAALHRYEHEDWAFYRFKVNQRRAKPRSWWQPWSKAAQFCDWLLLDVGCGYCTNPIRAVKTALVILIGFALIYMAGIDHFHIDKVPFEAYGKTDWPNRIMFSLVTSVAVFTSGLSGIKDIAKDWMNVPLVIEAILGTLLWGLFIVAFSRKVIR